MQSGGDLASKSTFFYKKGAGPLFDRGIYYLTTLVFLFGEIKSVGSYSDRHVKKRYINDKNMDNKIDVDTNTHYTIIIQFVCGVTVTMIVSFDSSPNPQSTDIMTLYGLRGVVKMPTPLEYDGVAEKYDYGSNEWKSINNNSSGYFVKGDVRGPAIMEMVNELNTKKIKYNNASLATHVIKAMNAIEQSGETTKIISLK